MIPIINIFSYLYVSKYKGYGDNKNSSTQKRKDGKMPLALRITQNRIRRFKFLSQYVFEKDWDESLQQVKSSHPSSRRLNNFLLKELKEANDVILEADTANKPYPVYRLKTRLSVAISKSHFSSLGQNDSSKNIFPKFTP